MIEFYKTMGFNTIDITKANGHSNSFKDSPLKDIIIAVDLWIRG